MSRPMKIKVNHIIAVERFLLQNSFPWTLTQNRTMYSGVRGSNLKKPYLKQSYGSPL